MPRTTFLPDVEIQINTKYLDFYDKYESYTMVSQERFVENLMLTHHFTSTVQGHVVECGTWKGGMACGMMRVAPTSSHFHFFDSFEGLPEPAPIDGSAAQRESREGLPKYHDNCTADLGEFTSLVNQQGVSADRIHIYAGWFSETLGMFPKSEPIAVLRLDGDWYSSTMECLEHLYPSVAAGGVIIIDDYDAYDGCPRAVHDYLSANKSLARIHRTPVSQVAYLIKYD